jgi:hypothetical protein
MSVTPIRRHLVPKLDNIKVVETLSPTFLGTISGSRKFELLSLQETVVDQISIKLNNFKLDASGGTVYSINFYVSITDPTGVRNVAVTRQIASSSSALSASLVFIPTVPDHLGATSSASTTKLATSGAGIANPLETSQSPAIALTTANIDSVQIPYAQLLGHPFGRVQVGFEISGGAATGNLVIDADVFVKHSELGEGGQFPLNTSGGGIERGAAVITDTTNGGYKITTTAPADSAVYTQARYTAA